MQEADPKSVLGVQPQIRDPVPAMYKAMKNFIEPPKSSPTKASSSSQASMLENSQAAASEGQGDNETQDESVLKDPANVD